MEVKMVVAAKVGVGTVVELAASVMVVSVMRVMMVMVMVPAGTVVV